MVLVRSPRDRDISKRLLIRSRCTSVSILTNTRFAVSPCELSEVTAQPHFPGIERDGLFIVYANGHTAAPVDLLEGTKVAVSDMHAPVRRGELDAVSYSKVMFDLAVCVDAAQTMFCITSVEVKSFGYCVAAIPKARPQLNRAQRKASVSGMAS
jgi:hypothetical protein